MATSAEPVLQKVTPIYLLPGIIGIKQLCGGSVFKDTQVHDLGSSFVLSFSCNKAMDSSQRAGHLPSPNGPVSETDFYVVPCLSSLAG